MFHHTLLCVLQMAQAQLTSEEAINFGRMTLAIKKSVNGKLYILVSQPVKGRTTRRCCWFSEDWMAIKAAIPQVQGLLTNTKKEKVTVTSSKDRTITFTVGDKSVLINVNTTKVTSNGPLSTTYSTWMRECDWMTLVAKQKEVDAAIFVDDVRSKSSKRKREGDKEGGRQSPCEGTRRFIFPTLLQV